MKFICSFRCNGEYEDDVDESEGSDSLPDKDSFYNFRKKKPALKIKMFKSRKQRNKESYAKRKELFEMYPKRKKESARQIRNYRLNWSESRRQIERERSRIRMQKSREKRKLKNDLPLKKVKTRKEVESQRNVWREQKKRRRNLMFDKKKVRSREIYRLKKGSFFVMQESLLIKLVRSFGKQALGRGGL